MNKSRQLRQLFMAMLKIGLFTFGGGYSMLPLFEREFVEQRHWIGQDEFLDITAIAESTPGPLAVNFATYAGFRIGKTAGAALATFAVCLPSFVIVYLISLFFDAFLSLKLVSCAFRGIQVCVVYLILSAGVRMLRQTGRDLFSVLLLSAVLVCSVLTSLFAVRFSSVLLILAAGAAALGLSMIRGAIRKNREKNGGGPV